MANFGNGPWKEGRQGAASLCYRDISAATLTWVLAHHAAVGIRATLVGCSDEDLAATARQRNWDLAEHAPADVQRADADARVLRQRIDGVASAGDWAVWLLEEATLTQMGEAGHADLLRWLGDEHARIWCAPVKDISAFAAARG